MLDIIESEATRRQPAAIPNTSDDDLIESIAAGDRQAMQTLFVKHKADVLRFATRIVRNPSVAAEVTNEVFLDVWRKAGEFESRSRVSTWLFAITRNKALDALRRQTEALEQDLAEAIVDEADDPEAAIHKKESSGIVRECLSQLSPAHRTIIDLIYFQERSIGEVAKMSQLPENTVKTRMFYARKRMEGLLIDKGIDRSWHWVQ
jgi:RNA polymerase sigma-70 factor (ECF subfamily)